MEQKEFEFNETNFDGTFTMDNNMNSSCSNTYMNSGNMMGMNCCGVCSPIEECPQERVCHRYMCYEVSQD